MPWSGSFFRRTIILLLRRLILISFFLASNASFGCGIMGVTNLEFMPIR